MLEASEGRSTKLALGDRDGCYSCRRASRKKTGDQTCTNRKELTRAVRVLRQSRARV